MFGLWRTNFPCVLLTLLLSYYSHCGKLIGNADYYSTRHGLMLLWFTDLMNVTKEVTIHRPNVSTLLSSAFIRGDLNAATKGPKICKPE